MTRAQMRRADAGVDSITVNGQPPGGASGPLSLEGPLVTYVAPNRILVENGLTNTLGGATLTSGIVQADLNTDLNNSFEFNTGNGAGPFTIPAPAIPLQGFATAAAARPYVRNRKITFTIVFGVAAPVINWNATVDGYQWANTARGGSIGPFLADWTALCASAQVGDVVKVGFEYYAVANANSRWVAVALAGLFLGG
jgi:hypothetical protein